MALRTQWTIVAQESATDSWWREWDRLNHTQFQGHPMLSSQMVRLLLAHFGRTGTRLAAMHEGSRVIAHAIVEPVGLGRWRIACPSQSQLSLMVFDREIPNGVKPLRGLLRSLPGPGLALEVPCQDGSFSWLAGQDEPAMHRVTHGITMGIRADGEFEDYWSARPKELRDNVRRHARRVEDEGLEPRLERIDEASRIGGAVDRYGELESQGWKGQHGTALHPTNQQGRFYRALLEAFASTGAGRVYELFFGDGLVASRLVISGPSMHVILKTTHDEKLRRYIPGHLQLQGVLRDLLSRPDRLPVELYTKADRDWLLWSTHSRNIDDVSVYRNALVARVASWRRRIRQRTKSPLVR